MSEIFYEHYGRDPDVEIDSVVHTYLNLRVTFNMTCQNTSELLNPDNYKINVISPTSGFDFGSISVTPEQNVEYPIYVDIEVTDCTGGEEYELEITPFVIEAEISTPEEPVYLSSGGNTIIFTGVTESPEVLSVIPLSLTQVKVVFNKYMAQLESLYDPTNYIWSNGINTLKVEEDTNSSVILTVSQMTAFQIYDLTVG